MKRLRIFILAFALLFALFVLASCEKIAVASAEVNEKGELVLTYVDGTTSVVDGYKVIVDAAVNDDGHLILTYSDGTTEDRGFQTIPAVTVTFVDHDGTVLGTAETYRGLGVSAPADPEREDYVFAGWDTAFDKVMGDTTVTATYTAKETFTVTFKDYDGTVLKTETVTVGKDATPPAEPVRADYNFAGWQGSYTAVTANVEVIATYTEKGSYTVTFMDYNGLVLDTVTVKEGKTATTSVTPTRDGYTFKGWSSSLLNITANKTVTAQYTLVEANNVFDIAYKVSGDTVTLTLSLAGNVSLAGFEGALIFEGMTATEVVGNSANVLANLKGDGTVAIAYTSATNVTKGETVLTVTLTKTADNGKALLSLSECFNQSFEDVSYKIIGENMKLESEA